MEMRGADSYLTTGLLRKQERGHKLSRMSFFVNSAYPGHHYFCSECVSIALPPVSVSNWAAWNELGRNRGVLECGQDNAAKPLVDDVGAMESPFA